MMKLKNPLLAFVAVSVILTSCKLIDKLTQFNVPYTSNFIIPASPIPGLLGDIFTPDISTNSEQVFSNNNTNSGLLEQVLLKTLKLTITSPSGKKFDFLKSADVYLSADGLAEIKVASIDNIDDATVGSSINMVTSNEDLKEYLKKSKFKIRVVTTTDKIVTEDVSVKIDASFFVDAKILGV